jgi:hypothetical protein
VGNHEHLHPLIAWGTLWTGLGGLLNQYAPTLFGFALTLVGLWLERRENKRHEQAMGKGRG